MLRPGCEKQEGSPHQLLAGKAEKRLRRSIHIQNQKRFLITDHNPIPDCFEHPPEARFRLRDLLPGLGQDRPLGRDQPDNLVVKRLKRLPIHQASH